MCGYEIDWNVVAEFSKQMLTPMIGVASIVTGIATVVIARQQKIINKQNLDFDLFDRRLKVYDELRKIIAISLDCKGTNNDLICFHKCISDAHFIFDDEIVEYLQEVSGHCSNMWSLCERYNSMSQPKPVDIANDIHIESVWLANQQDIAKNKFRKAFNVHK